MKPFFSIIVPCCDVEPYVRECLDSVSNQPFTDWECLIGVETSKDKTEEIVRAYESEGRRVFSTAKRRPTLEDVYLTSINKGTEDLGSMDRNQFRNMMRRR